MYWLIWCSPSSSVIHPGTKPRLCCTISPGKAPPWKQVSNWWATVYPYHGNHCPKTTLWSEPLKPFSNTIWIQTHGVQTVWLLWRFDGSLRKLQMGLLQLRLSAVAPRGHLWGCFLQSVPCSQAPHCEFARMPSSLATRWVIPSS